MKRILFLLTSLLCLSTIAQNKSDSIASLIEKTPDWTKKARLAYEFAKLNLVSNPEKCLSIYSEIQQNQHFVKDSAQLFNLYNIKGVLYQYRHELDSSNLYFDKALSIAEAIKDTTSMMKSLGNLGINYTEMGEYQKSVDIALRTLDYYHKKEDPNLIASAYSGIANNYAYMKNYPEAMLNARKSLFYFKAANAKLGVANLYGTIGFIFDKQNKLDSALHYTQLAYNGHQEVDSIYGIINSKRSLCSIYKKLNNSNEELLSCNLELLELDEKVKDKRGIMLDNLNIGKVLYNLGKFNESIPYNQKALELAIALKDERVKLDCIESLSLTHYKLKEFEKAYQYLDSTREIEKKLLNIDIQEAVIEADKKYQVAEKENEILRIEAEKNQAEIKVAEKNSLLVLLIGGFILLALLGAFFFYRTKQKARQKQDAIRIEEQQKGLSAVIQVEENERRRIAKELHDGIVQQLVGLKLGLTNYFDGNNSDESKRILTILSESCSELREISHQMMPRVLSDSGLVTALDEVLKNSLGNTGVRYNFEHFEANLRFNENLELAVYRIAQELINNVIKHSDAKEVAIQLLNTTKHLILIVEDDGKGMGSQLKKPGIGLMNISSRLDVLNGKVNFEPSAGSGTLATVKIPINT